MTKLYQKSEITFAILWIVIYAVGMGTLQNNFGLDSVWHMLGLIVISAAIFLFVKKNGLMEKYGLAGWAKNSRAMLKDGNVKAAVIVSSITFGMGHIMNLFTGHELIATLIQVVFAVAMGFVFTLVFFKSGSLLPGILAHSFIDVASVFASNEGSQLVNLIVHIVVIVVSVAYCLYLGKRVETPAINRAGTKQEVLS